MSGALLRSPRRLRRALAGALVAALAAATPAAAQLFGRPPADIPEGPVYAQQGGDAAGLAVRLERLESQMRTLTGQVEQLQNQNRRLEDQLKRFQQDVDFRFQEQSGGKRPAAPPATPPATSGKRGDAIAPGGPVVVPGGEPTVIAAPAPAHATPSASSGVAISPNIKVDPGTLGPFAGKTSAAAAPAPRAPHQGRGDAFDPSRAPDAPGAPRPLGAAQPSAPLTAAAQGVPPGPASILDEDVGGSGPLDLQNPRPRGEPRVVLAPPGVPSSAGGPPLAAAPTLSPYEQAISDYKAGRYEVAEQEFKSFVEKNPRDRRVADAIYYRGETFLQRGRHAEAASQYMNVATNYGASARAPDALLKLGLSLVGMNEREQACAIFAEIPRKHPGASNAVRAAEREAKRHKC